MKTFELERMYCCVCGNLLSFEDHCKLLHSCCSEGCWRRARDHQTALLRSISVARRHEHMPSVKTYRQQVRSLFALPVEDVDQCLDRAPWRYTVALH